MPNLSNVNITITATDATGPGVSSAIRNVSSLNGTFASLGTIAGGVFGGVLGASVFSSVARGIGNVVTSAFGLNNRLKESQLASQSMIDTISQTESVGSSAFGKLSAAAREYERTIREIQEREKDGLDDYALKVDDIKNKILEAEQAVLDKKEDSLAQQKRQLDDLNESHAKTIRDINQRVENEEYDHTERLYDLNRQKTDKLANLEEKRSKDTEDVNKKIADLESVRAETSNQIVIDEINRRIGLYQDQLSEINAVYDAQTQKVITEADHEIQVENDKHTRKLAALRQEISDENAEYDKKKKRIEEDTNKEIADNKAASDAKVANLKDQLTREKELHDRFLRDIKEAYADANEKASAGSGAAGGAGGTRTIKWKFDFADSFRDMDGGEIDKFLNDVQEKYVAIGVRSPFNVADIQQFGKSVIQFTGGSADNMEKMVDMAMSLAAKNPVQGMLGATTAMVELLGSGNITSLSRRFDIPKESLMQIQNAQDPGEAVKLLDEALQRNGITLGLVEAKTQTLGGAWQNIAETFNLVTAQIAQPVWQWLTDKLVAMNEWLFNNRDQIKQFTDAIGGLVGGGFQTVIDLFTSFGKTLSDNKPFLESVKNLFEQISEGVGTVLPPILETLGTLWASVMETITTVVVPGLERIFATFGRLWQEIAPELKKTLDAIMKWWTENHDSIMKVVKMVWSYIETNIKITMEVIGAIIKVALALLRGDWGAAWDAVKTMFVNVWNYMKDFVKSVWDGIGGIIKMGINGIIDSINGFINGLNEKLGRTKIKVGNIEIGGWQIPTIPKLAAGGIVSSPTLAMIGEAGPEAVVPLKRGGGLGGNIIVEISGNYILNDEDVSDLADKIGINLTNKLALQGAYL